MKCRIQTWNWKETNTCFYIPEFPITCDYCVLNTYFPQVCLLFCFSAIHWSSSQPRETCTSVSFQQQGQENILLNWAIFISFLDHRHQEKVITGSHKNIQGYLMELKYFWHINQEAFQHLPEFAKILEKVLSKQIYPWDHCFMMYISPVSHKTTCQDRSNAAGTAEQSPTHTRGCPPVPFIPGVTARVRSHSSHLSTELFLLLKPKEGVQVNTKRFIGFPCIKGTFFLHSTNFIPS